MNEEQLVQAAASSIRARMRDSGSFSIVREFRFLRGRCRADAIVLCDRSVIAIEVKTEFDSLRKLEDQTKYYSAHFDKLVLCISEKHEKKLELMNLPDNCDVLIQYKSNRLKLRRRGKMVRSSDAYKYAPLLNDEQIASLLSRVHNVSRRYSEENTIELLKNTNSNSIIEEIKKRIENVRLLRQRAHQD
ncbi:sce7726 family protein [Maricaulis sp.]|uniref:sce7726 family protein n=1 Tax=Maricaulis sp. TaxID=1486257 RepID=UPI003A9514DB